MMRFMFVAGLFARAVFVLRLFLLRFRVGLIKGFVLTTSTNRAGLSVA
jgi:hypothetical protein